MFIGVIVLIMAVNFCINELLIQRDNPNLGDCKILVTGDSHVKTSINPKYLPGSCNVAQTGEPYVVSFHKLKRLLQHNPGVEKVILGFSFQNISTYNDLKFHHPTWARSQFNRIYTLINPIELEKLPLQIDHRKYAQAILRNKLLIPRIKHSNTYIGEFTPKESNLERANIDLAINRHYFPDGTEAGVSETAVSYLDSITALVEQHNKELILVNCPVHEDYIARLPKGILKSYNEIKNRMSSRNVQVLDFSDMKLSNDEFLDYDHISMKGASRFSKMLNTQLDH